MPDSTRVAERAVRIDWLIARQHAENAARNVALANGATPGERREFHWRARAIADETAAAQAELAAIFAERHGWRQTRRPFSVGCLAVQGSMGTAMRDGHGRLLDHACYFRKGGRAAAAVGHVYDLPREARAWPRSCRLVLFTPMMPLARARQRHTRRHGWPAMMSRERH